jgi:elongation factor P
MAFTIDGQLYVCFQFVHITPGNLRAHVQAKLRRVVDGVIIEKRLRSTEDVEQAYLDRREMEYLYSDKSGHVLMDKQNYDQVTMPNELLGESIHYFKPNTDLIALVYQDKIVAVELPKVVELAVTETNPVPKGATVTNQLKEAVLETGLKTRVPPFIQTGEVVRISTEDGSYLSRAK